MQLDEATRASLVDEITAAMPLEASFFRRVPEEMRRRSVTRIVALLQDGLASGFRVEPVRAFGLDTFKQRLEQGAVIGDILAIIYMLRRIVMKRLRQLATGVEEAMDAAEIVGTTLDTLVSMAAFVFQTQFDATLVRVRELEASYQHFYEATPTMAYVIDPEARITAVSDRWLEVLGYKRGDVIGRHVLEFVAESRRQHTLAGNMPPLMAEGMVQDIPEQFIKKDGALLDVLLSSVIVRDAAGGISHALTVLVDVTERLHAEQALRDSEERYRCIVDLAPMAIVVHRDERVVFANARAARLQGVASPSELIGRPALEFIHPDDRPAAVERIRLMHDHGEDVPPTDERFIRPDGSSFLAEVSARPIVFDGEPAIQVLYTDITEQEQIKAALHRAEVQGQLLRTQEETLRALAAPIIPLGEGVVVIPLIGRITAERADTLLTSLAEGVVSQSARVAIIDVTGVPVVDGGVAEALVRTASAIRLLGARVVLTGVQPAMARTLVELGVELGGIVTRGSLREGIAYATRR
jgi:rsbT co-antagonist protein RsbR